MDGHLVVGVVGGGEEEVDKCPVCAAGVDDECFGIWGVLV